ncbi:polymer-forming cytoskeletal protein [Marinibaculum pumilum]|uniref:Polymer-forming cytoskeletal protein n=1 Tax=Marinibaculum pumilum TaxID=1766165 RepID=A0ABV7KWH6_9PROT
MTVTGNLDSDGEIQVDGTVIGDVKAERLTLGEGARILGEVVADDALIRGEVTGCLRVVTVAIERSAKIHGDVFHRTMSVEAGAFIQGLCQNTENPRESAGKAVERGPAKAEEAGSGDTLAMEPGKPVLATEHGAPLQFGNAPATTPPWRRAQEEDRSNVAVAVAKPDGGFRKD